MGLNTPVLKHLIVLFAGSLFVYTYTRFVDKVAKLVLNIPRFTYPSEVFFLSK